MTRSGHGRVSLRMAARRGAGIPRALLGVAGCLALVVGARLAWGLLGGGAGRAAGEAAAVRAASLDDLRAALTRDARFADVGVLEDASSAGAAPGVLVTGRVKNEADLAELRRLVEAGTQGGPVAWDVRAGR